MNVSCPFCNQQYDLERQCGVHLSERQYPKEITITCDECGKQFDVRPYVRKLTRPVRFIPWLRRATGFYLGLKVKGRHLG